MEHTMRTVARHADYLAFRGRTVVTLVALGIALMSSERAGPDVHSASVPSLSPVPLAAAEPGTTIRPFRINVPEAELADLRRRVLATRWPDKETVTDQSQGIQLAKQRPRKSRDEVLNEITLYWLTNTVTSAGRLVLGVRRTKRDSVPRSDRSAES